MTLLYKGRGLLLPRYWVQIVHSRDVEGAVPYDHEIVQNPSTATDLQAFKTVGDDALDVP